MKTIPRVQFIGCCLVLLITQSVCAQNVVIDGKEYIRADDIAPLKEKVRDIQKQLKDKEKIIQDINAKRAVINQELSELRKQQAAVIGEAEQKVDTIEAEREPQIDYSKLESKRNLSLQEENRFLTKRLDRLNEQLDSLQRELVSVRNEYLKDKDLVPETEARVRRQFQDKFRELENHISSLESELALKQDAYRHIDTKSNQIADHLTQAEAQNRKLRLQIETLEKSISDGADEIARSKDITKEAESRIEDTLESNKKLKKELKGVKEHLSDKEAELSSKIKHLESQLSIAQKQEESSVENLTSQNKKLEQEYTQKIEQQAEKIASLEKNNEVMKMESLELSQEITNLNQNLTERIREINQLAKSKTTQLSEKDSAYKERIDGLNGEIAKLEEEFKMQSSKLESMISTNEVLTANVAALEKSLSLEQEKKLAQSSTWLKQADELKASIKQQQESIQELSSELTLAVNDAKQAEVEKNSAVLNLSKIQTELKVREDKIAELEKIRTNVENKLTQKVTEKDQKISQLNKKIDEMDSQIASLSSANSAIKNQYSQAQGDLTDLKKKLMVAVEQQEEIDSEENKEQLAKISALETNIDRMRMNLIEKENDLKRALSENELIMAELIKSKDERIKLNKEILALNKSFSDQEERQDGIESQRGTIELTQQLDEALTGLIKAENAIYEKELIIEDLKINLEKLSRALEVSQENNELLKVELQNIGPNQVSFKENNRVMDIELDKLETVIEQQYRKKE